MTERTTNFWGEETVESRADFSQLTPSARRLREKFVEELMIDYDPHRAALRCGYMDPYAQEYAAKLMTDPYVMQKLVSDQDTLATDPEVIKKRVLAGLLREANYNGPGSSHSARVGALAKLAAIHGLETDAKGDGLAGNVLVVPEISNVDDWEKAAQKQQSELVRD